MVVVPTTQPMLSYSIGNISFPFLLYIPHFSSLFTGIQFSYNKYLFFIFESLYKDVSIPISSFSI